MAVIKGTLFTEVYESFLSKTTDDMYMQLTPEDTYEILRQLLLSAISKFEFPRQSLQYKLRKIKKDDDVIVFTWSFINKLTDEEINILSSYMIVEWIGQQLASIENIRMKYSGPDFKFTSQANHIHKLIQLKKEYERESFHLQRLYKRRKIDKNGIYRSTFAQLMDEPEYVNTNSIDGGYANGEKEDITIENLLIIRGDSFTFDLMISDIKNIDITSLYFTVKDRETDNYIFQKKLQDGITFLEDLKYRIRIAPQDTINIAPGKYKYDLEIGLGSDIYTIMMGAFIIKDDVTKRSG